MTFEGGKVRFGMGMNVFFQLFHALGILILSRDVCMHDFLSHVTCLLNGQKIFDMVVVCMIAGYFFQKPPPFKTQMFHPLDLIEFDRLTLSLKTL